MKKILYDLDKGDVVGGVYDGSISKVLSDRCIEFEVINNKPPIDTRTHFYSNKTTVIDTEHKILYIEYMVSKKPESCPDDIIIRALSNREFKDAATKCGITREMIINASQEMNNELRLGFLRAWEREQYVYPQCNFVLEIKRILNVSDELLEKIFILGNTGRKRIRK